MSEFIAYMFGFVCGMASTLVCCAIIFSAGRDDKKEAA